MQEEIELRKSRDFKLRETNKKIRQIKKTIEYRIKLEELKAQPIANRKYFHQLQRYQEFSRNNSTAVIDPIPI